MFDIIYDTIKIAKPKSRAPRLFLSDEVIA